MGTIHAGKNIKFGLCYLNNMLYVVNLLCEVFSEKGHHSNYKFMTVIFLTTHDKSGHSLLYIFSFQVRIFLLILFYLTYTTYLYHGVSTHRAYPDNYVCFSGGKRSY